MEIDTTVLIASTLGGLCASQRFIIPNLAAFLLEDSLNLSPPLKPIPTKRIPSPDIPILPTYIETSSDSEDETKPTQTKKRRRKVQPRQGDAVLLNYLSDWNRPDLANQALQDPLQPEVNLETPVGGESDQEMEVMSVETQLAHSDLAQVAASGLRFANKQD